VRLISLKFARLIIFSLETFCNYMKLVSADMIARCNILVLFRLALEGKIGVVVPVLGCIRGFGF
jgi:hypothetical protein